MTEKKYIITESQILSTDWFDVLKGIDGEPWYAHLKLPLAPDLDTIKAEIRAKLKYCQNWESKDAYNWVLSLLEREG